MQLITIRLFQWPKNEALSFITKDQLQANNSTQLAEAMQRRESENER